MTAATLPQFSEATPYFLPTSPATPSAVPTQMHSVPTYVDAQMAQYLLQRGKIIDGEGNLLKESQVNTRPISLSLVRVYANDMIDGLWRLTHEGVAITPQYEVLDGKHTMLAIMEAYRRNPHQRPVPVKITYNADPSTFSVVNTGKSRNVSDLFAIQGIEQHSRVGHAARLLYCYLATQHYSSQDAAQSGIPKEPAKWARVRVSNSRLAQTVAEHPGLVDDVSHTVAVSSLSKISAGALITARYLIVQACQDQDAVRAFFEVLRTGQDLPYADYPAFTLRDWSLRQGRGDIKVTRNSVRMAKGPLHLRLLAQAWNHACEGRPITKISYKVEGLVPEPSPKVPILPIAVAA